MMTNSLLKVILILNGYILISSMVQSEESKEGSEDHWIVQTNSGPVEGTITVDFKHRDVHVFYGIPYAEPPTGKLRFKPPQAVQPWKEVLKATKKPLPCYQTISIVARHFYKNSSIIRRPWSEDCLKLNVWVPKPKVQDAPVLVTFHSGFFAHGSSVYPDGSTLSAQAQDVIVSMNYRLGPFGFLNFGVPEAPGNVGLMDQQLALKWVHENIHHFGGKSEAVILVGAGNAGAASVGYHLLSPGSAGYFKTISPFSGSPTCSWAFVEREKSLDAARALSQRLGCHKGNTEEELDCLRNAHPEDIVHSVLSDPVPYHKLFVPTVDGTFMSEPPLDALKNGHFNKVAVLSISNAHEGSLGFAYHNSDHVPDPEKGLSVDGFRKAVKRAKPSLSSSTLKVVEEYYTENCDSADPIKQRDAAIRLYSDLLSDCCMNQMDEYLSDAGLPVFRAVDDVRKSSDPSWVGSPHAISVKYAFGYPLVEDGFNEAEKGISDFFMDWINEHTRKKATEMEILLARFSTKERNYTFFDVDGMYYRSNYRVDHCQLWNDIVPRLEEAASSCSQD